MDTSTSPATPNATADQFVAELHANVDALRTSKRGHDCQKDNCSETK
jgi:hypothetical protein